MESEISLLTNKIDDIYRDFNRKITNLPNERELEFIHSQLKEKISQDEFKEALEQKANKQAVTAALQSKLDRYGLDELLKQKSDFGDIQKIFAALESKADYSLFEQLSAEIQNKADRSDINQIVLPEIAKKSEKFEIELMIKELKSFFDKNFLEHASTTDAYINSFKADLEQTRRALTASLTKKIEAKEIEKLYSIISKKADFEVTVELLEKIKHECREIANDIKKELKKSEEFEFNHKLENEIFKVKEDLGFLIEKHKNEADDIVNHIKNLNFS